MDKFTCTICNNQYKYKKDLLKHNHEKHSVVIQRFKCNQCAVTFTTKGNLSRHTKEIDELHHHVCEICKKVFREQRNLKNHLLLHHTLNQTVSNTIVI